MRIRSSLSLGRLDSQMQGFLRAGLDTLAAHNALWGMRLRCRVDVHRTDFVTTAAGYTAFFIQVQPANTDGIQQAIKCPQWAKHFAKETADKQTANNHGSQYYGL